MIRWANRASLISLVVVSTLATAGFTPTKAEAKPLANAVVLIVRHAEKSPESGDHLTPEGDKRAAAYVEYFQKYKVDGETVHFTHLFAASDSKKSHRPRLTIEPLSKAIHMQLDLRFSDKDPEAIATDLKGHDYGNRILISWRHGEIPALISALGGDPKPLVPEGKWPDSVYDRVIELHFDSEGKIVPSTSKMVREHLMPGDSK